MMDVKITELDNGVRVITSSIPHVESVSMGIWVGVGARYEQKNMSGVSHFVEHLLFKGTKKRSAVDISQAIEGRGGYINAFTQEEHTCYYVRVPYDQLWHAQDVLSDMYFNPRLAKSDIDKERGVIVEEMMMYRDQPHYIVQEMLEGALWKNHPLGRPVIGTRETLAELNRARITDYKRKKYVSGNTVFAFAGKVDHEACVSKVARYAGRLRRRAVPECRKVTHSVAQGNIALRHKDIEQAHLALGIRLFGRSDKRRYALKILNAVLGENMSSRLFQIVREKHGLAYSVHSGAHLYRDSGALVISAGLDRKRSCKAVNLIIKELIRLKERQVGRKELKRAKDYAIGQLRLGLESTSSQMMWIGDNMISRGKFTHPQEIIERLSSVTAEEVQSVACSVMKKKRTSLCMVSPDMTSKDESGIQTSLQGL
ncbi:M16 family metallopeptidase [Verrucomicrobiota bacterium]